MAMTATSGVASAKNAACKALGYHPIEGRVNKVRLKHGRDRERTSSCLTAGYSIARQYSAVCETDTYIHRERKTTDVKGVCIDWTQEET